MVFGDNFKSSVYIHPFMIFPFRIDFLQSSEDNLPELGDKDIREYQGDHKNKNQISSIQHQKNGKETFPKQKPVSFDRFILQIKPEKNRTQECRIDNFRLLPFLIVAPISEQRRDSCKSFNS
ncbi:MAG: hypothetical protein PHH16_01490 [Candidatus Gracilibacteria bacterium]|nr:hypothetical protein [Candidatus Gracilibacteria bacterium]